MPDADLVHLRRGLLDAILAGASGYVVKDIKGMELATAIKDVGAGDRCWTTEQRPR